MQDAGVIGGNSTPKLDIVGSCRGCLCCQDAGVIGGNSTPKLDIVGGDAAEEAFSQVPMGGNQSMAIAVYGLLLLVSKQGFWMK